MAGVSEYANHSAALHIRDGNGTAMEQAAKETVLEDTRRAGNRRRPSGYAHPYRNSGSKAPNSGRKRASFLLRQHVRDTTPTRPTGSSFIDIRFCGIKVSMILEIGLAISRMIGHEQNTDTGTNHGNSHDVLNVSGRAFRPRHR